MSSPARPFPSSTLAKQPLISVAEGGPDLWLRGEGSGFTDRSGKSWLDFDLCLGNVVWGHARAEIVQAAAAALSAGSAPSTPSLAETQAAKALLTRLPQFEAVCFFKGGGEACAAGIRLSRLAAGRDLVLSDGYHGWHDWAVAGAYPALGETLGVPPAVRALTVTLDPTQGADVALTRLEAVGSRLAAAMFRPEAWPTATLREMADAARHLGAIVIFDEVTSHLKYSRQGCGAMKGIRADLLCIAKGLANGLAIAVLLGPAEVLNRAGDARISSTNWSETTGFAGLCAAEALLEDAPDWPTWGDAIAAIADAAAGAIRALGLEEECMLVRHPGYFSIERRGMPFGQDPFRRFVAGQLARQGLHSRGWFHGSDAHDARDWARLETAIGDALAGWRGRH